MQRPAGSWTPPTPPGPCSRTRLFLKRLLPCDTVRTPAFPNLAVTLISTQLQRRHSCWATRITPAMCSKIAWPRIPHMCSNSSTSSQVLRARGTRHAHTHACARLGRCLTQRCNQCAAKVEPLARREWEKMIALKKATVGGSDNVTIDSHDFTFYNQVRRSLRAFFLGWWESLGLNGLNWSASGCRGSSNGTTRSTKTSSRTISRSKP